MKRVSKVSVILFFICAIIWSIKAIFSIIEIIKYIPTHPIFWYIGDIVCAIIWILAFVIQYRKYKNQNDDQNN